MKKVSLVLVVFSFVLSTIFAQGAMDNSIKSIDEIKIVESVPVSEKGYSFDSANPYLPPVSGLAHNNNADGVIYSVYVPKEMAPWSTGVIILCPDGISAEEFSLSDEGRRWLASADKHSFALGFVESSSEGWNTTLAENKRDDISAIEAVYTQMRSKSVKLYLPFTMDKSRVNLVGYKEGGAMALTSAAASPSCFASVVAINSMGADAEAIKKAGSNYCFPFPADGMRAKGEVKLVASTLPMPAWIIGDVDDEVYNYYATINKADEYSYNKYASLYSDSSNEVASLWRSKNSDSLTPEVLYTEFVSKHTRPLGVEGGNLAFATEFITRSDGSGYHVTEETFDGLVRRYMTYVPSSYDEAKASPMVLVLHGYTATMYALAEESRWADVAEKNGLIVVFAQGYPNENANPANIPAPSWISSNLFGQVKDGANDTLFLTHVIEETKQNYNIDSERVYGTGHSNGCAMTLALASERSDLFTAIAPIGFLAAGSVDNLDNIMPVSIYYGEYDSAYSDSSYKNATEYWTRVNGVDKAEKVETTSEDGRFITETYYTSDNVPLVQFTKVTNSAHCYFPAESWRIWNEFFSHYNKKDGILYYDGKAIN